MLFFSFCLLFCPEAALRLHRVNKVSSLRDGLRHWVVSTAPPRVAGEDSLEGEPAAFEEAVFLNRLDAVVGTGGYVATALANEGRQRHLINPNQEDQELSRQLSDASHGC